MVCVWFLFWARSTECAARAIMFHGSRCGHLSCFSFDFLLISWEKNYSRLS
jgi:hypothetical protein